MTLHRKVIAEYINQIREDIPGTCVHKKAEHIIRGYDCKHLIVPKSEFEPIGCDLICKEVTPNCFCCWAEKCIYPKEHGYKNKILQID